MRGLERASVSRRDVLTRVLADGGDRPVADERVGRQVADALPQVDAADALALAGHSPDFGLREAFDAVGGTGRHGRIAVLPTGVSNATSYPTL